MGSDYIYNTTNYCSFMENETIITEVMNSGASKEDVQLFIRTGLMSGQIDSYIDNAINEVFLLEDDDVKYEITTTNDNNVSKNVSFVKLGGCEDQLRQYYNISEDESLVIFKTDKYEDGYLTPKVEYEVYDMKNKRQLDLNKCKNMKVQLLLPCVVDENNLFKYNISSEYYNDLCYSYTTDSGTDIILSDRQNEYKDNKMALCEDGCEYGGYNSDLKKSECKCDIETITTSKAELGINKELLNSFINFDKVTNFNVVKCYKELFTENGLKHNFGSYVMSSIIILSILSIIVFTINEFSSLKKTIDKIIRGKTNNETKGKDIKNIKVNKNEANTKKK